MKEKSTVKLTVLSRVGLLKQSAVRTGIEHEKEFYGVLTAYDSDSVTITKDDGAEMKFAKSDMALIRLAFDF